ncbi:MAG: hypothetical protein QMD36_03840 [Candidatus Aenigmarchaeota archaeon]|nr:hypothetical protein [Candidatus Aenigmarchaeota archaeon]
MESKNKIILFSLILFFLMIDTVEAAISFKAWSAAPVLFTVGRTESVNIYVQNTGDEDDSYNITYTKQAWKQSIEVPHLISVSMPSYKIKRLKTNETGDTFAKITILGPIDTGNVTFNVTSETQSNVYHITSVEIRTGSPIILQEFSLFGVIQILILATLILVISYASYLS